jgi:hypothetical protein
MRSLLLLLTLLAGCGKQEESLVGKWRPMGIANRDATIEFFADGKVQFDSAEALGWKLSGRELEIIHPQSPSNPVRIHVTFPDAQHLEFSYLCPDKFGLATRRRFERIVDDR